MEHDSGDYDAGDTLMAGSMSSGAHLHSQEKSSNVRKEKIQLTTMQNQILPK